MIRTLAAAMGLLTGVLAGPALASPPAWVVSDADSTVYLVGTVHMLPDDAEWWSEGFEAAFGEADTLWLELDLLNPPADLLSIMLGQAGSSGTSLRALVDDDVEAALEAILMRHGIALDNVDALQPWFVYMQLSSFMIQDAGYSATSGIDFVLASQAMARGIPVRGLEEYDEQFGIFSGLSLDAQVSLLSDTVRHYDEAAEQLVAEMDSWLDGQLFSLMLINIGSALFMPEVFDALFLERNRGFADDIESILEGAGTDMVAVGLAHFVGPGSIVSMLRQRGYTVERWTP